MNDDVAVMMNKTERKRDIRRRKIADMKYSVWFFFFKAKWRFLHLTGLARPYGRAMCRLRLYEKFPDGRCQWCGVVHIKIPHPSVAKFVEKLPTVEARNKENV